MSPSPVLKELIRDWNEQSDIVQQRGLRFNEAMTTFLSINQRVWDKCIEEGIPMSELIKKNK